MRVWQLPLRHICSRPLACVLNETVTPRRFAPITARSLPAALSPLQARAIEYFAKSKVMSAILDAA